MFLILKTEALIGSIQNSEGFSQNYVFWDTFILQPYILIISTNNFRGDLIDISALKYHCLA